MTSTPKMVPQIPPTKDVVVSDQSEKACLDSDQSELTTIPEYVELKPRYDSAMMFNMYRLFGTMPAIIALQMPSWQLAGLMAFPYLTAFRSRPQTEFMILEGLMNTDSLCFLSLASSNEE
mmetsp:Transcript_59300/g.170309  ORF Transcript_59300/g.170309 Transcript_59300/m.170309 type:complete len:120 (-) Transcript_59300:804-1163(-)